MTMNIMRRSNYRKYAQMPTPGPLLSILVSVAFIALAYLWMYERNETLGREIIALEQEKQRIIQMHKNESYKWQSMRCYQSIQKALDHFGLVMDWPKEEQIIRIYASEHDAAYFDDVPKQYVSLSSSKP